MVASILSKSEVRSGRAEHVLLATFTENRGVAQGFVVAYAGSNWPCTPALGKSNGLLPCRMLMPTAEFRSNYGPARRLTGAQSSAMSIAMSQ